MAKKPKKTPEQIAAELMARKRQDFEAVGLDGDAAALEAHQSIQITRKAEARDGRTVDDNSARRLDGIEAVRNLLKREGGCYDALRRFERDLMTRRGEADKGRFMERVDDAEPKDILDRIIQAGRDLDGVMAKLSPRDWQLIHELVWPSRRHDGWRGAVKFVTAETNEPAQAAVVRAAAVNLRDAYEAVDQAKADEKRRAA